MGPTPRGRLSRSVSAQTTLVAVVPACLVCGVSAECRSPPGKGKGRSAAALGHAHTAAPRAPRGRKTAAAWKASSAAWPVPSDSVLALETRRVAGWWLVTQSRGQ